MAEKIKGSTDKDLAQGRPLFFAGETTGRPATLVVHDHKHERVFTESEVKAMLMRASHLAEQHTGKWVSFSSILDPA